MQKFDGVFARSSPRAEPFSRLAVNLYVDPTRNVGDGRKLGQLDRPNAVALVTGPATRSRFDPPLRLEATNDALLLELGEDAGCLLGWSALQAQGFCLIESLLGLRFLVRPGVGHSQQIQALGI
jgi:hypothetical protein